MRSGKQFFQNIIRMNYHLIESNFIIQYYSLIKFVIYARLLSNHHIMIIKAYDFDVYFTNFVENNIFIEIQLRQFGIC